MVSAVESKDDWLVQLGAMLDAIESWARGQNWTVTRNSKEIADDGDYPPYTVDVLTIDSGESRLCVEPIGRFVFNATGRLDLYTWPSLQRLLIVRENAHWSIRTDSGTPWPKAWGPETFVELVRTLAKSA